MLEPNVENRGFFNERVAKHCGNDRAEADSAPIEPFVSAVKAIQKPDEAERFFSGMVHWVRSRRPRTIDEALVVARSNIRYCLEEDLSDKQRAMWQALIDTDQPVPASVPSPEVAFKTGKNVTEQIKAGKDVGAIASMAKKALAKKVVTPVDHSTDVQHQKRGKEK